MRLEQSRRIERFGAVRIHELQRVIQLDPGDTATTAGDGVVPAEAIRAIQREMVVVVPCMDEMRGVIEGVLAGIPQHCLVVLVSNSARRPVDRYEIEVQTLEQFCQATGRSGLAVHQRDPDLAAAFAAAGLPELTDATGRVRAGKGEAMLVGLAIAALTGRQWVGYIDADNYSPGAVHEYVTAYAAGLHLAANPYAMVRICWHSKPKLRDGRLFFSRRGRSSEVINAFLNRLVAEYSGFGTDVIDTGNAGEHAFGIDLGLRLRLAGGFAVEPFEYIDLFEQFGGVLEPGALRPGLPGPLPELDEALARGVPVLQIGTRNPHFHDNKGEEHVRGMRTQALNVLYHSPVTLPAVRAAIHDFLVDEGVLPPGGEPPRERIYPPVGRLELPVLRDLIETDVPTFRQFGPGAFREFAGAPRDRSAGSPGSQPAVAARG
jgi:mannosyl-3-phosphoglycerate synthase